MVEFTQNNEVDESSIIRRSYPIFTSNAGGGGGPPAADPSLINESTLLPQLVQLLTVCLPIGFCTDTKRPADPVPVDTMRHRNVQQPHVSIN